MALEAFKTNIGAYSYYFPLIATTGMGFAQSNYVAGLYVYSHFWGHLITPPVGSEPFTFCHSEGLAEALSKAKGQRLKNLAQGKLREESLTYTLPLPSRERNKERVTK